MMSLRFVLVALAVVCAAQAYAIDNHDSHLETHGAIIDIFDKIAAMLEQTRQRIKDLDKELKDAVDTAYEKVQAAVNKEAEVWYQVIQKAVEQANKQGIDVSECISENHALTPIAHKMVEDSRQCIAAESPVIEKVQQKMETLLDYQAHLLDSAKTAVKECEDKPLLDSMRCNVQNMLPLAQEAAQVFAKGAVIGAEVASITVNSANNVRICVKGVFRTEGQAAKQIVDKATQCIREKINQGSNQFALY